MKNFLILVGAILILIPSTIFAMTSQKHYSEDKASSVDDPNKGRDFSTLSFNKDGSELMFNECFYYQDEANQKKKYPEGTCQIFRLNLANKTLSHYDLPEQDKYTYTDGSFSPNGNYVVMKRAPKNKYDEKLSDKENAELAQQNYEQSEISVMKADGTNFKVIKMASGLKARPIMSNDETKIAYVRSEARPQGSKTYSHRFDVYEIDLKNKTDRLFAGPYQFFETGQMQYFKGDNEILMHAYVPRKYVKELSEYTKRYNNSSIYAIKRGEEEVPEPMVVEGASDLGKPFITKDKAILFYGTENKTGTRLFKRLYSGNLEKWKPIGEFIYKAQILSTKDEKKIFFIYFLNKEGGIRPINLDKCGIAFLDTATSKWTKFNVPEANSSRPITVTGLSLIETNQSDKPLDSLKKLPNFSLTNPINSKK